TFDGSALGIVGGATGVLARPDGTVIFCIGSGAGNTGPATFRVVRLLATGALDPGFGGTGIVSLTLTPGTGLGAGAPPLQMASRGELLGAGPALSARGSERAAVLELRPDGSLDTHFGHGGIAHVARSGRDLRVTALVRDARRRIVLVGDGAPPDGLVARLHAN